MVETKKRKGIGNYQLQGLRNVVKANGDDVIKDFIGKYRALKIKSNRGKAIDTFTWEDKVCQDRDSTVKGLEETHKEEIITRKEKEEVIQEEDNTLEDIREDSQCSQDIF